MTTVHRTRTAWLTSAAALLLAGLVCACVGEPGLPQGAGSFPPVSADKARLYFYRIDEPYETLGWTTVYLNGQPSGTAPPGAVLYRDVPPGTYKVTVRSHGLYPDQFKTVTLDAGESLFIRIESLRSWQQSLSGSNDTFVVAVVNPDIAQREISQCRYWPG